MSDFPGPISRSVSKFGDDEHSCTHLWRVARLHCEICASYAQPYDLQKQGSTNRCTVGLDTQYLEYVYMVLIAMLFQPTSDTIDIAPFGLPYALWEKYQRASRAKRAQDENRRFEDRQKCFSCLNLFTKARVRRLCVTCSRCCAPAQRVVLHRYEVSSIYRLWCCGPFGHGMNDVSCWRGS